MGVRSTFYRFAMITGQGLLIILAGFIESNSGLPNLDITVNAKPDYEQTTVIHPDSLKRVLMKMNYELKHIRKFR